MPRSAPSFSHSAHFSGLPAVANTRWPKARAIWIAVTPMPLLPPCTSSVSPAASLARSNTLIHTVKNVSGSEAASTMLEPLGHGKALPRGRDAVLRVAASGR